jgi:HEAT repeat protein
MAADSKEDKEKTEKKQAEWIRKTLRYGIQSERKLAIEKIPLIEDKARQRSLLDLLTESLRDELDTQILVKGFYQLSNLNHRPAVDLMEANLDHKSEDVRNAAVYGLKKLDARGTRKRLMKLLQKQDMSKDSNFNEALIRTLAAFEEKDLVPWAIEKIRDPATTRINRENLLIFLGEVGGNGVEEVLLEIYTDEAETETARSYAVNGLAKLKVRSARDKIREQVETIENYPFKKRQRLHRLYMYSIAALVRLGDREAYPRLVNGLRSNNADTRVQAARLLKELEDKRSIDILRYKMNYDPDARVRKLAREALEKMGVKVDEAEK